ncbi:hypothetical protein Thivi_4431 [Thiocystis violascens DSM 198]|uniref:F5/8 type C domain-containing protein n=2 Tax=Thiocystis violascens TaxID=73141 RepID=I3YGW5_THIV6|nr:hypothetical protein Thivi_4431 [Thiocystis violascens DSM 198]
MVPVTNLPVTATIDLAGSFSIERIVLIGNTSVNALRVPKAFQIESSQDGASWGLIADVANAGMTSGNGYTWELTL